MTPQTLHLFAQLIRHVTAILTSIEKWLMGQPEHMQELTQVTRQQRRTLILFERWLSKQQTETDTKTPETVAR